MSNSILYYPTIEFRKDDYQWLWTASLLWDKIYRIVPPNHILKEPENIKVLCDSGEIGIPISPTIYSKEVVNNFIDFMEDHKGDAAAFSRVDSDEYEEYIKIHESKMDVKLQNKLFYDIGAFRDKDNWLYVEPKTANFYMTYLANHIAKRNSLSLYTGSRECWTTSSYFLYDGRIQSDFLPGEDYTEPSSEALVSMMVPDIYPVNILDISPDNILRFREKRKDERMQFIEAINNFRTLVSQADAPEVLTSIMNDEKKKVDDAIKNYKKSMDILKVARFGGVLTTMLTLTADALGYSPFSDFYTSLLASSGLWVDVVTGLIERKTNNISDNPYTYLAHIKSSFSLHSGASAISSELPFLSKYNYTLSRDFEEFIDD